MLVSLLSYFLLIFGSIAVVLSWKLDRRQQEETNKQDHDLLLIHELRSPMAAIRAASELLINQRYKLDLAKQDEVIKVIHQQSIKMLDHIALLLDTAKLESGMLVMHKANHDLIKLLQERLELFRPLANEKNITFSLQTPQPIPNFNFDEDYIGQVINNLLSNAIKFTPQHGDILLHTNFDGKEVSVSIKDSGHGLAEEEQKKLFQKFSQATRTEPTNSSGLGLYFAKQIIECHGGHVKLDSVSGLGTVITFSLPIAPTTSTV